jgi:hypothetical protein
MFREQGTGDGGVVSGTTSAAVAMAEETTDVDDRGGYSDGSGGSVENG